MRSSIVLILLAVCVTCVIAHATHQHSHTRMPTVSSLIEEVPIGHNQWLAAGNVAAFSKVAAIKSISLPIVVNLIFIGFDGDGNERIRITQEDLEPWFEHIDHTLDHLVAPVNDEIITTKHQPTPPTSIKYSFTTRVIRVSPLITTIIEDALLWHARPEDPNHDSSTDVHGIDEHGESVKDYFYVDAHKFSSILNSLVQHLKLTNTYTIFILNPQSPVDRDQTYGYRTGFSEGELEMLYKSDKFSVASVADAFKRFGDEAAWEVAHKDNYVVSTAYNLPTQRHVHWIDMVDLSEEWAANYIGTYVTGTKPGIQKKRECIDEEDGEECGFYQQTAQLDIISLAQSIAVNGTDAEKRYLYLAQNYGFVHENCLVDAWISHGRFAFLDLTAGPFEWGPVLASEGFKSRNVLPRVRRDAGQQLSSTEHDEEHQEDSSSSSLEMAEKWEKWRSMHNMVLASMKKKFNMLCQGNTDTAECKSLIERIEEFRRQFTELSGHAGEEHSPKAAQDEFLARLATIISKTYRHLIARPSPMFNTPFVERIVFQFHLVITHNSYDPLDPLNFNIKEFKHELLKLKLPNQEFVFAFKKIQLEKDKTLATAYRMALRVEKMPGINSQGKYRKELFTYLDSKVLHHELRQYTLLNVEHRDDSTSLRSIHVPVFMFSVDEDEPVLIDKYFQSRGLSDMVIIVQSRFGKWRSRFQCNQKPVYWNLRNPLKSALASIALTLYGVVPTHIHYDAANQNALQDWLWSIGDNPFSYTGHETHFSAFHKDIAYRNQIIVSLQFTVDQINQGVEILAGIKTRLSNEKAKNELPLDDLHKAYNDTRESWLNLLEATERLNWQRATSMLRMLEQRAIDFREYAHQIADMMDAYKCIMDEEERLRRQRATFPLRTAIPLSVALLLLSVALYILFAKAKNKLKIN